jgi:hypothetical protein
MHSPHNAEGPFASRSHHATAATTPGNAHGPGLKERFAMRTILSRQILGYGHDQG